MTEKRLLTFKAYLQALWQCLALCSLISCGRSLDSMSTTSEKPAAQDSPIENILKQHQKDQAATSLTSLPTPLTVTSAQATGRSDPFSPIPQTASRAATSIPGDFQFKGVISARGKALALVSFQGVTGTVTTGDKGGTSTDLLPSSWRVQSVDIARGRLRLLPGSTKSPPLVLEL